MSPSIVIMAVWYPPQAIVRGIIRADIRSDTSNGAVDFVIDRSDTPSCPSKLDPKVNTWPSLETNALW